MNFIKTYECARNHKYLLWSECPFCCAIDGKVPNETDERFITLYETAKGKSEEEIEKLYSDFPPYEPEQCLSDSKDFY